MNGICIALAADVRYSEQVITTIKSICFHNSNVTFYLLNQDYAAEWFEILNAQLQPLDSVIYDIKITNQQIQYYKTLAHISSNATYFRYFIPECIPAERVLYLDCDLVVNTNLSELFYQDMQGCPVVACLDIIDFHRDNLQEFNAGVLLIDNTQWRAESATAELLSLSDKYADTVPCGDQSILNIFFKNRWKKLHRHWNYQVGSDWVFADMRRRDWIEEIPKDKLPAIIHYTTSEKPWLSGSSLSVRFREWYWLYYRLDWQQIYAYHQGVE